MDDTPRMLADSAERLFSSPRSGKEAEEAAAAGWSEPAWHAVEEAGFTLGMVSEDRGGFGLASADALQTVRIAARHAVATPLAETMLANWLADAAGLAPATGMATIAFSRADAPISLRRAGDGWHLSGVSPKVPYGRVARSILVAAAGPDGDTVCWARAGDWQTVHSANLAGEPRDELRFDAALVPADVRPRRAACNDFMAAGAAIRTVQMAGALERVLDMTVSYSQDRVQFGRPIGKFQAVQQNVALLAATAAAAGAAADIAADALTADLDVGAIAAAKSRAGEAAGMGAAIAHQVHGAIGFTYEHALHLLTRKLWSWRDEFGNEAYWNRVLGRQLLAGGADAFWPAVVALGAVR